MTQSDAAERAPRLHALDAIRGIAALLVVFHHLHLALPEDVKPDLLGTLLRAVQLGRPMVIVFFVLSGFILAVSLQRSREGAVPFVIRRVFRVYLPFAAAILLAAALVLLLRPGPVPELSGWFNGSWASPVTPWLVACHLAMVGSLSCIDLDNPMWSLVVEMRWSLLFPALLAAVLLVRPALALVATGLLTYLLARHTALGQPYANQSVLQILTFTLYFAAFFVAGIALALRREALAAWAGAAPPLARGGLWLAAGALLSVGDDLVGAAGAALAIVLAPGARGLGHPALRWLGRVSYSLYLLHMIVVLALVHALGDAVAWPWLLAASLPASLVAAHLGHLAVERPCADWGRRAAAAWAGRGAGAA